MSVINTHNFGRFWSISCTINLRFGVPKRFPRLTIIGVRLHVHRQHSQYWPILTRFMDHYSPFWGPKEISILVEPQGALTCRSSTLAVFVDSDMFHVLLLTVLGSQSDFHDCRTPKVLLRVSHPHSWFLSMLTRFMDYYSVLGSRNDFHCCRTPGCVYLSVSNTHNCGQFWSVSWTITHRFRVPK